jgi:protein-tyrosine phosphatase
MDMRKFKILFVCLGNICRSPMAQAILEYKLKNEVKYIDLKKFIETDSVGLSDSDVGDLSDNRVMNLLKRKYPDFEFTHRAKRISVSDYNSSDLILVAEKYMLDSLSRYFDLNTTKVKLLRYYDEINQKSTDLDDPYYGDDSGFEDVFEICDRCISNLLKDENFIAQVTNVKTE